MLSGLDKISLLIVEDDDVLRNRLAMVMEKRGFATRTVSSVAEALSAIKQDIPAFAVIDLRLVDGSGLDVVKT